MLKKLSVTVVALSLGAIAQPALAQQVTKSGTIAFIAPATSTSPATMKIANDQYWVFIEAPGQPATTIFVNGKNAKVGDLKAGMTCGYTGTLPKAYLSKVSCQDSSPVAAAPVAVAQPTAPLAVTKSGTIAFIALATSSAPATMKIANDQYWVFIEAPGQPATTIFVNGQNAKVSDLKVGMTCGYTGTLPKAYLSKVSCQ